MSRRILDSLKGPADAAIAGATLRFVAWSTGYDAATTPRTADAVTTTGDAGEVDITLQNGVYQVFLTESGGDAVYLGKATITDGSDTTLAAVLGASGTVTSEVLAAIQAGKNLDFFEVDGDITLGAEHAGKTAFVTANAVITVSAWSGLLPGWNVEIVPDQIGVHTITVSTTGADTVRDDTTVITGDSLIARTPTTGLFAVVGQAEVAP